MFYDRFVTFQTLKRLFRYFLTYFMTEKVIEILIQKNSRFFNQINTNF